MTESIVLPIGTKSSPLIPAARIYLTVIYPVLLVLLAVRLVMTPLFLQFEYNRPGFPADFYGFTREDRLRLAPYAVDYLLNGEGIEYLRDLTFPNGEPLYNERELRHMVDVKVLTQVAFTFAVVAGVIAVLLIAYLWRRAPHTLALALRDGAFLSIAIILLIALSAVAAWDFFFTAFHQLFFEDGTWYFLYSDTLIRLFPEQFWFDASILIGAITVFAGLITLTILRITSQRGRRGD